MTSDEYRVLVQRTLPAGYLDDVVGLIVRSYRTADAYCQDRFPQSVARDFRPIMRRALIEADWLELTRKYPAVSAVSSPNSKQSAFHTRVRCGPIVLTASKVEEPDDLPRDAFFRKTYATRPQLVLDLPGVSPPPGSEPAPDADAYYALVTHGPAEGNQSAPSFVRLGFPTASCATYVAQLDLLAGRAVDAASIQEAVTIVPPEPMLRRPVRSETESTG